MFHMNLGVFVTFLHRLVKKEITAFPTYSATKNTNKTIRKCGFPSRNTLLCQQKKPQIYQCMWSDPKQDEISEGMDILHLGVCWMFRFQERMRLGFPTVGDTGRGVGLGVGFAAGITVTAEPSVQCLGIGGMH